ncbi:hypothetical protein HELRODRAFT_70386, partial [Helobdella robusta]|uniref:RFX-type winged-helix domain-containing protein n=1 Tax=Helobdella robusta TaxID=6412 RepID=T1G060_HELRO
MKVQWLRDNYEQTEGVSLPRSSLYINYQAHCEQCNLDPMNPASFGKLIRSIFPGLRTRRLGTRGHSQYHYYGIRIKPTSSLRDFDDRGLKMEHLRHRRQHHPSMPPHHQNISDEMDSTNDSMAEGNNNSSCNNSATNLTQNNQDFLGAVPDRATHFEPLDIQLEDLPDGCTLDNISTFVSLFKNHCKYFMKLVSKLQFSKIEALWISFWKNLKQDENENDGDMPTGDKSKCQLSKEMFYSICQHRRIQQFIRHAEHILYQAVVHVLLPDVLKPIPCSLTQSIRNFAKHMEGWMKNALSGVPQEILNIKMQAACALAQILRRYTSLNHLAQAARAVLLNQVQINQMLADINRIDFDNVQDQASVVCHCEDTTITDLLADFKLVLQQQAALEDWASWLKDVVDRFLGSTATLNSSDFSSSADQFLLKWSYYSSLIIRDLTLRSAASFGSFHLINLLFNEYMYYLVEHKVAESFGHTCIAGM